MMQRIAIFVPNWIGDAVMATPAIRAVREQMKDSQIIAVGRPNVFGVFDGTSWFDDYLPFTTTTGSLWRVAASLSRQSIDTALLFPNSFRSALAAWLGRCRRRIGFTRHGRSLLLTDRLQTQLDHRGRIAPHPILPQYNRIVEPIGVRVHSNRMQTATTHSDEQLAEIAWNRLNLCRANEVIGLNPGAAFGAAKLWPADYFSSLARRLVEERGASIVVLCGPKERELARRIARDADHSSVVSLADESVSLGLTKACISRLSLLVTTDSGPRHLAAALNCPVITLFGPTHQEWTQIDFEREIRLQEHVPCGPCQLRTCPTDHRCMTNLTVDSVSAAVRTLLGHRRVPLREVSRAG